MRASMLADARGAYVRLKYSMPMRRLLYEAVRTKPLDFVRRRNITAKLSAAEREEFRGVRRFCLFIGYPRSGHTLVGSLLDAHPNIVIAQELDVLSYVRRGYSQEQIFFLILRNAENFTRRGRQWNDYSYAVANQWNGAHEKLEVLGDKKGGASAMALGWEPHLLEKLRTTIDTEIKLIHVIRNPYDNIGAMCYRKGMSLEQAIEQYFFRCRAIERLKRVTDSEHLLDIRHEDLVREPADNLRRLCNYLGQEAKLDYLEDCEALLHKTPNQSRIRAPWKRPLIDRVRRQMELYDYLHAYEDEQAFV